MSKAATAEPADGIGEEDERAVVAVGGEYERMVAAIADYQRVAKPDAVKCRVTFFSPGSGGFDRSGVVVPLLVANVTKADKVIAFLSKFSAGEWVKGRVIAAELDMESDGGQFRKIMGDLVRSETVESGTLGYRLRRR